MALIRSAADALPYIDSAPSQEALSAADALIRADISKQNVLHPSIPPLRDFDTSPAVQAELESLGAGQPAKQGIDLSRYDAMDAPQKGDIEGWRATLAQAYASAEYLRGRELNLGLLETFGKNAWLISNSQLEDILRDLERDVKAAKDELSNVEEERRTMQSSVAGEMQSLQDTWRQGVGRMIEVQVAGERVRQEILARHRQGVS